MKTLSKCYIFMSIMYEVITWECMLMVSAEMLLIIEILSWVFFSYYLTIDKYFRSIGDNSLFIIALV